MQTEIAGLEGRVLDAIVAGDLAALESLLDENFVITTAGWLRRPANRSEWLAGLAAHTLREFEIRSVDVRPVGSTVVALVLSTQSGEFNGRDYTYDFRYTDVWVADGPDRWRLAVRHASIVPDQAL